MDKLIALDRVGVMKTVAGSGQYRKRRARRFGALRPSGISKVSLSIRWALAFAFLLNAFLTTLHSSQALAITNEIAQLDDISGNDGGDLKSYICHHDTDEDEKPQPIGDNSLCKERCLLCQALEQAKFYPENYSVWLRPHFQNDSANLTPHLPASPVAGLCNRPGIPRAPPRLSGQA